MDESRLGAPKIIAEVAQGYEGRADYCDLYVKAAAKAGADAVKFQIVYADDLAQPGYRYYEFYKTLEMDISVWRRVKDLANELDVQLFADVYGDRALAIAEAIRPRGIKIHSSDFFNRALLRQSLDLAERVFVSLGGIGETEIEELVETVTAWGKQRKLALLCGFQAEPTPIDKSNLRRLPALKQRYPEIEIGYMDHAPGESEDQAHLSLMAMAVGVDWIEKHLTLSRYLEIEDYVSAIEPDELATYVATLKRLSPALGTGDLSLNEEEKAYRDRSVKKIVAVCDLRAGHEISPEDIVLKRTADAAPFTGFHDPRRVIGKPLSHAVVHGQPIVQDDLA